LKPNKVRILGKDYKVSYIPKMADVNTTGTGDDLFGQIEYVPSKIRIFDGLGEFDRLQVLLHEIMHGVSVALQVGLDEKQIDLMATGLANTFLDNKMLKD
jgi:hypothetical protein